MKDIPNGSIDLILCDLPYGVTKCKWDSVIPFELLWEQYKRITKDNGAIVLFSAQPFTTALIGSNRRFYRYNWYWVKNTATAPLLAKKQPMRCVEDICVFYKKQPTYNPQGLIRLKNPIKASQSKTPLYKTRIKNAKPQGYTNYPKHVLYFDKEVKTQHPTQKPVALLEYLIRTYTNEGETVLDNCMGSGSTGVASVKTKRNFVGIEKDEKYYEIAKQRIENAVFSMYENQA